jgi:hypothetical protein
MRLECKSYIDFIYKTDLFLLLPVADLIQNTRRYYEINILGSVATRPTHVGPTMATVGKGGLSRAFGCDSNSLSKSGSYYSRELKFLNLNDISTLKSGLEN